MDAARPKRPTPSSSTTDDSIPPAKRTKTLAEEPAQYSDAVRKKLAATSRTGQACDRCKERKMKCDSNPIACQPCRQKSLRCFTTDRVTGQARERGETDRAENELSYLRDQLTAYQHRYGPLRHGESNGITPAAIPRGSVSQPTPYSAAPQFSVPDAAYVGWPAPENSEPLHSGPVKGTVVNIMDGTIDIADWECEMMSEYPQEIMNKFNVSSTSIINTIYGRQKVDHPKFPSKEDALQNAHTFLTIMAQYVPIVHRPSFMDLVNKFYDQNSILTIAEQVQVVVVFAILAHQTAVRNHVQAAEKFEESHRYLHYALTHHNELVHDPSLASMQAMALLLVHFRNLPKPGVSWAFCHKVLVRAIELEYHRDPDKINLPENERDPLSKELRIRVFHAILGICVTTGCRVGLPAPWQFQHLDIPLPRAIKDSEISERGIVSDLSGQCDFLPCLHLAKLLPLLTELYQHVVAVRKPAPEYLRTVEALNTKIVAWRQDWEDYMKPEPNKHVNLLIATLLFETWAAEYQLNLHHPVCCTSEDPEVIERHLDICHKSAKRLLQSFHILSSRFKSVDFTWHSTLAYAMGFGITLHAYRRKSKSPVTVEQFEAMRNELKGWTSLMAYADLVLRTGNHLQRQFQPRVQALEDEYRKLMIEQPPPANGTQIPPSPINGLNNGTPSKIEQSPAAQYQETLNPNAPPHRNSFPQAMFMQPQAVTHTQPQSPLTHQQPWPATYTLLPQPHLQEQNSGQGPTLTSPIYPTFSQGIATGLSTPGAYPSIPTSLASLLNHSGQLYMGFQPPAQSQSSAGGVAATGPGDPSMTFSPNHYFDGSGSLTWPLIAMGPGQQS